MWISFSDRRHPAAGRSSEVTSRTINLNLRSIGNEQRAMGVRRVDGLLWHVADELSIL